jgi:secreted trypsin-like serine protease
MSCDCFVVKIFFVASMILVNLLAVECQEATPRIVGGFNVTSMQGFRHQVSIRQVSYDRTFGNGHICGGSLISYRTVLTAGLLLDSTGFLEVTSSFFQLTVFTMEVATFLDLATFVRWVGSIGGFVTITRSTFTS